MRDLPERLARGERVPAPVVIVAAHPDDETLGLASRLRLLPDLRIVHLTDGAPRDLVDAHRAGYGDAARYAAGRRAEFAAALDLLGAGHCECADYGFPDQEGIRHLAAVVERLSKDIECAAAVVSHPYEWGHPDHDTAALAVALCLRRRAAAGCAVPAHYESPSYHLRMGERRFWMFCDDPGSPETALPLTTDQQAEKRRALDRFRSQVYFLGSLRVGDERMRRAPAYDFGAAAPTGEALYDAFGWSMTSAVWMREARAVLAAAA